MKTYHGLFKVNKEESVLLSSFSALYQLVYHHAYALWAKQQAHEFSHVRALSSSQIISSFNGKFPKFNFLLSSNHKKSILANKKISGRQLNSILFELQGNLKSLYEVTKLDFKNKQNKLSSLQQQIDLLKNKIKVDLVLLAYDSNHKKTLHLVYQQYIAFKSISTNQYKKFQFPTTVSQALVKNKYKLYTLIIKRNNLQQKINSILLNLLQGKLPLCFGSKALFHKQFNFQHYHKNYNPKQRLHYFKQWQLDWKAQRSHSFYLMGTKAESQGNQSCQALLQDNGLFTLKIRLPDAILLANNPNHNITKRSDNNYLFLRDINFGYAHDKLKQAISNGEHIHYRFTKNINKCSTKYGSWTIAFSIEEKAKPLVSNKNVGALGIDLNQEHISVADIDYNGNLLKAYDIPLKLSYASDTYHANPDMRNNDKITTLNSNQSTWVLEQVVIEICRMAKDKLKPIVVEELDFEYKKSALSNVNNNSLFSKKRNKQLSAFVYSKFKQALLSRAEKEGIEIIQVNPSYTSLLGLVKYQKVKGLSIHQAASYVIGRKGLGYKEKLPCSQESSSKKVSYVYRGKVLETIVPVRKQLVSSSEDFTFLKALAQRVKQDKVLVNNKLKAQCAVKTAQLLVIDQNSIP